MDMRVDQSGHHPLSTAVDHLGVVRNLDFIARSDVGNFSVLDQNGAVANAGTAGGGDDSRALDRNDCSLRSRKEPDFPIEKKRSDKQTQHNAASLQRIHVY